MKEEDIKKVSFWSIDSPRIFENGEVMDYMTVALSTQGAVNVVDRENLQLIYQEQKLNQQVFIDESQARRLGELYGWMRSCTGKSPPSRMAVTSHR